MTAQQCAVPTCKKIRRDGRPVCNRCLRRVGESVLHRWFGYKRAITAHPGQQFYVDRLTALHMAIGDGDPLRELVAELFPAEP